jgi:hypothetical protein
MTSTKPKKSKEKVKKIEETTTTTTDSDVVVNSPSLINPTHINLNSPKSPSIGFPSLSIPVPHSGGSSINGLISPDPSRIHIPQPSDSKCLYSINLLTFSFHSIKQLHIFLKFKINYKLIFKIHL